MKYESDHDLYEHDVGAKWLLSVIEDEKQVEE